LSSPLQFIGDSAAKHAGDSMATRLCREPLEDRCLLTSLSGYVYRDANRDGAMQTGEAGIRSAKVTLTGTDDMRCDMRMMRVELLERIEHTLVSEDC
jgi:hypothetical protein